MLLLPRRSGRLRAWRHAALLALTLVTAWAWFGVTGALPVLIWCWQRRPADVAEPWLIDLVAVRSARLGPWRTCLVLGRGRRVEIFHDEIAAADLARLRRNLKAGVPRE